MVDKASDRSWGGGERKWLSLDGTLHGGNGLLKCLAPQPPKGKTLYIPFRGTQHVLMLRLLPHTQDGSTASYADPHSCTIFGIGQRLSDSSAVEIRHKLGPARLRMRWRLSPWSPQNKACKAYIGEVIEHYLSLNQESLSGLLWEAFKLTIVRGHIISNSAGKKRWWLQLIIDLELRT